MKTTLLLAVLSVAFANAQAPTITGETMLCPNASGTAFISETQTYDSYTWYWKYWFTSDPFVAIPGANGPSFTYDQPTYDQALIKVVVTQGSNTYESNTLQLDSWAWVGITVGHEMGDNVTFDPDSEGFVLCDGTSFTNELFNPYTTNIQWYRDDVAIVGANSMTYDINAAGTYYVIASPQFCPDNSSTSLPITVSINSDCALSVAQHQRISVSLYPNPATEFITISAQDLKDVTIYTSTGQLVLQSDSNKINVANLAGGMYFAVVQTSSGKSAVKFIKQ